MTTKPNESEVPDEDEWDDEVTEVSQLREEMRASVQEARKTLSGVNTIAEDLRRAIAAQGGRKVRRSLTPASFPAVVAADEA